MSKDFRASQVETSKLIASGGISGNGLAANANLGLAIYSGSRASNREGGIADSAMFSKVGTDVFLFVSGTVNSGNPNTFNRTDVTLFGGDLVVSGTLYAERQVVEVDQTVPGNFFVTGNMFVQPDSGADSSNAVVFRNSSSENIFRVNSSTKRVGIGTKSGDTTIDALLDLQGSPAHGAPSLKVDHGDTDKIAIQVLASNIDADVLDITADAVTTANVIDVSADALTTGTALKIDDNSSNTGNRDTVSIIQNNAAAIGAVALSVTSDGGKEGVFVDKNYSDTAAATIRGVLIDVDKTAATTSDNTIVGVDLTVNNESPTNGTNNMSGIKINATLIHAADAGTTEVKAIEATATGGTNGASESLGATITATGADINTGIKVVVPAGTNDSHVKLVSSADHDDLFKIKVAASGATTITTIDDGGEAANLSFAIDGALDVQSYGAITIDSSNSTIGIGTDNVNQNINIGSHGTRSVTVGAVPANGSSTTTINSRGGTLTLEGTGQTVDINSAALDIDASGAINIDGTSTMELVAVGASKFKSLDTTIVESAKTGAAALLLSSSHAAGGIKIEAGTGNLEFNSDGAIDINAAGDVTINDFSADSDFRVETNNLQGAILLDAGTDTVILRSNATTLAEHAAPAKGNDVAILLSGTIGSKGTSSRGVSLLAGDAHLSGAFSFSELATIPTPGGNEAVLYAKDDSGVTKLFMKQSNGTEVGPLGSGGSLDDAYDTPPGGGTKSAGAGREINVDGLPVQIKVSGTSKTALAITGSVIIGSGSNGLLPAFAGPDTNFFVSGSILSKGSSVEGTSVFGGDLVVSGNLHADTIKGETDIVLEAPGDIVLDADAGNIYLKDSGTTFLAFQNTSNDAIIYNSNSNKDIIFKGNSGAIVEILRIDVSAKDILMAAGNNVSFGASTRYIGDGTDFAGGTANDVVIQSSNGIITAPGAGARTTIGLGTGVGGAVEFTENNTGNNILMLTESNGSVILSSSVHNKDIIFHGNNGQERQRIEGAIPAVQFLQPGPGTFGEDVNFIVSGSIGKRGLAGRHTTAFGGDIVVSGGIHMDTVPGGTNTTKLSFGNASNVYIKTPGSNALDLSGNSVRIGAGISDATPYNPNDTNLFVSGAINSRGTSTKGTSVFGGDVVVSGSLLSKKLIDVKTFCPSLNNSTAVMFLPNPNRTAISTTNINDHTNMLMPFSGSLIKMTMDVQSACTIGISLHKAQDETAISHFTASFENNEIKEFNIKKGLTGSYTTGPHSPPAALEFSGSYAFDPGEQLAFGFQKKSGSTPGTANINLIFEYDVVSKTLTD